MDGAQAQTGKVQGTRGVGKAGGAGEMGDLGPELEGGGAERAGDAEYPHAGHDEPVSIGTIVGGGRPGQVAWEHEPDQQTPEAQTARVAPAAHPSAGDGVAPGIVVLPPSRWGVLRYVHYRNIWIASLVSNIGNWMEQMGVQMQVAKITGDLRMLGTLAAAYLGPILIFGTLGGVVADRVNRRTMLLVTQFLLMLIAGGMAAVSYFGAPPIGHLLGLKSDMVASFMVLSILQGSVTAFNMPAWQVLTPRLVPRVELTKAITLNGMQFNGARVLGPVAAGFVMAALGPTPLFIINTLSFLGVLIAITTTPDSPAPARTGQGAWQQVKEAARFIFGGRGPRAVFTAIVLLSLFAAPLVRVLPLYVIDVYRIAEASADLATGWMMGGLGLGAVLGGFALKLFPDWYPKHHFIPLALACCGGMIAILSFTQALWIGLPTMIVCGVTWLWAFNQSWSSMQHLVPDAQRGRVMAISNVFFFGFSAVGNLAVGYFGEGLSAFSGDESWGTQMALRVMGGILLIAGVVMLMWRVPEVDGIPSNRGNPSRTHARARSIREGIMASAHRRQVGSGSVVDETSPKG